MLYSGSFFKLNLQRSHTIMFNIGHQGTGKTLVRKKEQLGHRPSGPP